jgi:hypothetical protein
MAGWLVTYLAFTPSSLEIFIIQNNIVPELGYLQPSWMRYSVGHTT